jgi:hypothetical protein
MPGTPGIRIALIIALLVSAWVAPAVAANEPCLKLVFGRYCLGGDMAPLLQANPPPIGRQDQGASMALVFTDGPDRVYALGFSGRLYKVVRAFAVSTQLRYDETYAALRDIYGPGEEQSRFPDYATTPARRLAAIRRGVRLLSLTLIQREFPGIVRADPVGFVHRCCGCLPAKRPWSVQGTLTAATGHEPSHVESSRVTLQRVCKPAKRQRSTARAFEHPLECIVAGPELLHSVRTRAGATHVPSRASALGM